VLQSGGSVLFVDGITEAMAMSDSTLDRGALGPLVATTTHEEGVQYGPVWWQWMRDSDAKLTPFGMDTLKAMLMTTVSANTSVPHFCKGVSIGAA